MITPWDNTRLTRRDISRVFPCFGHFDKMHCFNLGFIYKCPYERLCKKEKAIADEKRKEYLKYYQGGDKGRRRMYRELEIIRKVRERRKKEREEAYKEFGGKIHIKRK